MPTYHYIDRYGRRAKVEGPDYDSMSSTHLYNLWEKATLYDWEHKEIIRAMRKRGFRPATSSCRRWAMEDRQMAMQDAWEAKHER